MRIRSPHLLATLTLIAALAACSTSPPAPVAGAPGSKEKPLELIVFPGGFNWPVWVAQDKGLFAQNGVTVKITPTPNSVFQLTGLIQGKFDLGMTAIDNLIAYREGQGEAPIQGPDLVAVMGGDNGFLRLTSVPEVKTIGELRGKTVSVDARTTGYAFVLFEILDRNGLREPAYSVERAGGVLQRYQALLEKKHAATLLLSPFEVQAQTRGFNVLADAVTVIGPYQGLVLGTRRSWAEANRGAVVGLHPRLHAGGRVAVRPGQSRRGAADLHPQPAERDAGLGRDGLPRPARSEGRIPAPRGDRPEGRCVRPRDPVEMGRAEKAVPAPGRVLRRQLLRPGGPVMRAMPRSLARRDEAG